MLPLDGLNLHQSYIGKSNLATQKQKLKVSITTSDLFYKSDLELPAFYGFIFMGIKQTAVKVKFDTGQDWLIMPSPQCELCENPKHDPSESGNKQVDGIERSIGYSNFKGSIWTDKACLVTFIK